MREIEFRGKSVENNGWEYGGYDEAIDGESFIISVGKDDISHIAYIRKVREETVGQFTGLRDRNGKEIYEGDIVKGYLTYTNTDMAYIEYDADSLGFSCVPIFEKDDGKIFEIDEGEDVEVIGNIYDNPELLEERK